MGQTRREREILLLAMNAGRILLENGAEIFRVEETIDRICRHFGLESANAFVLSNGIFLTCGNETETQFARVQVIPVNAANLSRVAEVNQLSRLIESGTYTLEEAEQELKRIEQMPGFSRRLQTAASAISGACFCFMFGGGVRDMLCAMVIGAFLQIYLMFLGKPRFSKIVCHLLGGAGVTLLCLLCCQTGLGISLPAMLMADIILMVPGIAFTNGIRDIADGDYIAGSVRILDAILVFFSAAMGMGFLIALWNYLGGGVRL